MGTKDQCPPPETITARAKKQTKTKINAHQKPSLHFGFANSPRGAIEVEAHWICRCTHYQLQCSAERDGSNEYHNYQPGSLNTTNQLFEDLKNFDIVFHIGDITYATGYILQWDQFTSQVEPIASTVPYMIASGNHEREWPDTGSFYENKDSGGECGVLAETMFWYSTDYGMFHFCIADSEHDWREGTEQYQFIERCLAFADRRKQPWLIFAAHRVLGYSSAWYPGTVAHLKNPWEGKACRGFGRSTG
ncbi:putative inactive purple acid phosphatase 27 [Morella rubra]|uniref:Putative inactive purple acid phosphatase 27 n=1 Tax=Morella rubra TaxID=262757 RepID=A0A6A1W3J9_9ROSI|nr:putative inactive purple acid phosphatase 27 [Morella rubra]